MQPLTKIRVSYQSTCKLLDLSREGLRKLIKKDPTFPRPIKEGNQMPSPVYFDYSELVEWHNTQREPSRHD